MPEFPLGALEPGIGHFKRNSGKPHPLEPALQHSRRAVVPGRVDHKQPLGPFQVVDVIRVLVDDGSGVRQVIGPFLLTQDRLEFLSVEIAHTHVVACRTQGAAGGVEQGGAKALTTRVTEYH